MRDIIYRQDAIDALWKALYEYEDKTEKQFTESDELEVADWICHRIFVQNMSDIDRQTILALPSAQPERKKGKWIRMYEGQFTGGAYWFECSDCGRVVPNVRNGGWNFCPNCGADMRGGQDENN